MNRRRGCSVFTAFFLLIVGYGRVSANDTLFLSLPQIDSLFIQNNLMLIAAEYNIEGKQALEISAKMYPLPLFTVDLNIYDPQNNKAFHVGNTGQKQFILEQLILIGGKRKVDIDIAKKNTDLAKLEFEDFLRTAQYNLHASFYSLNRQYQTILLYDKQLKLLDTLIKSYEIQVSKGNIPLKELIRLKSIYIDFNSIRSDLIASNLEEVKKMEILLHTPLYIIPILDQTVFNNFTNPPILDSLLTQAFMLRPDVKLIDGEGQLARLELKHQKLKAVPDLKLNFSYDQRGGAFLNQFNSGFTVPLPLWSFNRGNIKFAQTNVKLADLYFQMKKEEIEREVSEAYLNLIVLAAEYVKAKELYNDDFTKVYNGITENFTKRNISIIEFTDFMEAYTQTVTEIELIKSNLAIAAKKINFVTATNRY